MKKSDKAKLKFKNSIYKFAAGLTGLMLEFNFIGGAQDLVNLKEVKAYKEVIDDFQEFLDEQGIYDPVEIFDYFNYALWNGYLSEDHTFGYSDKRDIFFDKFGIGNILGQGVCLNNAGMLKDLYEAYGYDSSLVLCYVPMGKVSVDSTVRTNDEITRNVDSSDLMEVLNKLIRPLTIFTGNHAVTVVEYNGEYYYFDPTNLAYLAKTDIDDLEIINGDGSFKKRYIMNFVYELTNSFKNMFGTTNQEYIDNFANIEEIEINIDALENFYQEEKDIIYEIAQGMNKKPQALILLLAICLAGIWGANVRKSADDIIFHKAKYNEEWLKTKLRVFFIYNHIYKFEDICSYLHYLINNGYLTYQDEDMRLRKSLCTDSPSLVTIDYKEFGEDFFNIYMKSDDKKNKVVIGIDEDKKAKTFYMHESFGVFLFYSYEDNLIYRLNENGELVNGNKKYKLVKLFKKRIMNSRRLDEDINPSIDQELCKKFYEESKDKVEEIAKKYTYKRDDKKTS